MTVTPDDWQPFDVANSLGDPGRQPEVRAVSGALCVGVPDTVLDFLSLPTLEIRACAARGWSHRYQGTPRQDFYAILTNDDLVVMAVADGVSAGDFSQVAAETAARSACKLTADQVSKHGEVDWVQLARRVSVRILDEAEYRLISQPGGEAPSLDERLRECLAKMSTTLIVAVIQRVPGPDGNQVEIGVVAGDSVAYVLRRDAEVMEAVGGGKASTGPITSSRVRALPGPVEPAVTRMTLAPGDALFIASDGIGDLVGGGQGEVGRELARRWTEPPGVDRFLLDVNAYRRSFDDDRTVVGTWVRPPLPLPPDGPLFEGPDVLPPAVEGPAGDAAPPPAGEPEHGHLSQDRDDAVP